MSGSFRCPNCGRLLVVQSVEQGLAGFEELHNYPASVRRFQEVGTAALPVGVVEFSREQPARAASMESDVWVPAAQAGLAGLAGSISLCVTVAWSWPWYTPLLAAGCVMCGTWGYLLADHRRLLRSVERVVNRDLDRDGTIGEPAPAVDPEPGPTTIEVTVPRGQSNSVYFLETDVEPETLRGFCRAVTSGRAGLAVGAWVGAGRPFSRPQYDTLMNELTRAGLVENAGGNQGRQLTRAGRHVLARIAEEG